MNGLSGGRQKALKRRTEPRTPMKGGLVENDAATDNNAKQSGKIGVVRREEKRKKSVKNCTYKARACLVGVPHQGSQ